MELMSSCFDKLLKSIRQPIPEPILGKLAYSVNFRNSNSIYFIYHQYTCIDCDGIELSQRKTWHHASRFENDLVLSK